VSEQDAIDGKLLAVLRAVSPERFATLQRNLERLADLYRFYAPGAYARDPLPDQRYPDGGALALLAWDLDRRKRLDASLTERWRRCRAQLRDEPHYNHNEKFCGAPRKNLELRKLNHMLRKAEAAEAAAASGRSTITALPPPSKKNNFNPRHSPYAPDAVASDADSIRRAIDDWHKGHVFRRRRTRLRRRA